MNKGSAAIGFSEDSLKFLKLAGKQKNSEWIVKNDTKYQNLIRTPLLSLAEYIKKDLASEARGYHFPQKGIGRIKKPSHKIEPGGPHYKDWISYIATRPSKTRFEKNPLLFFGLLPNDPDWNGVVVAGGLYMTSSVQMRRVRQAITDDSTPFKELFEDSAFKKSFKNGFDPKEKAQKCPQGFDAEHPDMDWIKLRTFFVCKGLTLKELSSKDFSKNLSRDFKQLLRLNELLQKAIDGNW